MARRNISLPDDLDRQLNELNINVSGVCAAALRRALNVHEGSNMLLKFEVDMKTRHGIHPLVAVAGDEKLDLLVGVVNHGPGHFLLQAEAGPIHRVPAGTARFLSFPAAGKINCFREDTYPKATVQVALA